MLHEGIVVERTNSAEANDNETNHTTRVGRLLARVIDFPRTSLLILILLSGLAFGGYANPGWPGQFYRWMTGDTSESPQAALEDDEDDFFSDEDRPRRRKRGGGIGQGETLLVIESQQLFTLEGAEALRAIVDRLESLPTVRSVSWMDTAPPLNIFGLPEPIVPRGKASPQRFAVAREKAIKHPLVVGQTLSSDAETTLILVNFNWVFIEDDSECTTRLVSEARDVLRNHPGVDMRLSITGEIPIRLMIDSNRREEEMWFQLIGYAIILATAFILFAPIDIFGSYRRLYGSLSAALRVVLLGLLVVIVTATPPILGVVWTLGFIRYFGWEDNPFSPVIVPVLISLVGFTDSVHMMVFIRRKVRQGSSPVYACRRALSTVGLACFLTSLTTAIGMGSLSLANHEIVREFGWACVIGVFVTWITAMLIIPLACRSPAGKWLAVGEEGGFVEKNLNLFTGGVRGVLTVPRFVAVCAAVLMIGLISIASTLRPDEKTSSMMPEGSEAQRTLAHLDKSLGGLDICRVDIDWKDDGTTPEEVARLIGRVDTILDAEPLIGHPLSVCRLLAALPGDDLPEEKMSMIELLPPPLKQSLYDIEQKTATIIFRVQDLGTAMYKPVFERLEVQLKELEQQSPEFHLSMAGLPIWRWENLYRIVVDLTMSLGTAIVLILIVLTIAFRSIRIGLISLLPNTLPLAAAASWLVLVGKPLDMVSVCAFTICLGISVDDTVHFLTRYWEEQFGSGTRAEKIERAFHGVGTGLIMTTLVLIAGFGSVLTSQTPDFKTFAALGTITLATAIFADLFLLPALLSLFDRDRQTT